MGEFTDLITIAEMTPGPIAVNSATFVGIRIAGWQGAVIATFGCILPSCLIVSLLACIYYKYKGVSAMQSVLACLRPAVVALIAAAGISILRVVLFAGLRDQPASSQLGRGGIVSGSFCGAAKTEMESHFGHEPVRRPESVYWDHERNVIETQADYIVSFFLYCMGVIP